MDMLTERNHHQQHGYILSRLALLYNTDVMSTHILRQRYDRVHQRTQLLYYMAVLT